MASVPAPTGFASAGLVGDCNRAREVTAGSGTWNAARRIRQPRFDRVTALGLRSRVVDEPASTRRSQARRTRILPQMPNTIQIEMPASTGECRHLASDDGVAVE
jgi:hypothetical protein